MNFKNDLIHKFTTKKINKRRGLFFTTPMNIKTR